MAGALAGLAGPAHAGPAQYAYSGPVRAEAADDILSMVNAARADQGVGPVRLNSSMSAVAGAWSQQMADAAAMSHNPSYSTQIPGGWSRAAENVAWNSPADATGLQVAWMDSPGHRSNILDPAFTDIGIGVVVQGGSAWGTQVFGAYGAPLPLEQAPIPAPAPAPAPAPEAAPPAPAASEPAPVIAAPTPAAPEPAPVTAAPTPVPTPTPTAAAPVTKPSATAQARTDGPGNHEPAGTDRAQGADQVPGTGPAAPLWVLTLATLLAVGSGLIVARERRRRSGPVSSQKAPVLGGAEGDNSEP